MSDDYHRGERGPTGDHGQHGDKGDRGDMGPEGPVGDVGRRGPTVGFDWIHMLAYLLLAGAFVFTTHQNREQTQDILKAGTVSCQSVNDLRTTLRSVLKDQIEFAKDFPTPPPSFQKARLVTLQQNIDALENRPC